MFHIVTLKSLLYNSFKKFFVVNYIITNTFFFFNILYSGLKGLISSSRKRKMQAALNKRAIESESTKSKTTESQTLDAVQSGNLIFMLRITLFFFINV